MNWFAGSRSRLIFAACLLLAGWFTYTAVAGRIRNEQIDAEHAAALAEVRELEEKKAYLQGVIDYVSSDAYVEQEARRELGFVRDGEIAFAVVSPKPAEDEEKPAGHWWERLFPR